MARFRHPRTVGLGFVDWPERDQLAWTAANQPGDIFTDGGLAASWRDKTRRTAMKAYGNFLRFLKDTRCLVEVETVGERLTLENLRDYIAWLRKRVSPQTVVTQLRCLSQAIRAMDPGADREMLNAAISRLNRVAAVPSRDKAALVVSPAELLKLGLELMATWQQRDAHDPRLNAMDYRDGLMIALLALCPLRLANLAQMEINRHLIIDDGVVRLRFASDEMKGGKALDVPFPDELLDAMCYYLDVVRPMMAKGPKVGDALWPNMHKKPMAEHGIYTRITQLTETHFGHPVTPHMFRDAAATFIAEMTPDRALMAAAVLQHRSFATTLKHYIHGQQHKASRCYQAAIAEIRQRVEQDDDTTNVPEVRL